MLQSPLKAELAARATVVKTTVPNNMAEAIVDSGAVSDAENRSILVARWVGVHSAVRVPPLFGLLSKELMIIYAQT